MDFNRLMEALGQGYSTVNGKNTRKSDRQIPGEPMNIRSLLEAAQNIPFAGDALSGGMAAYDAANGDYKNALLNAIGILPFVPGVGGMIKEVKSVKNGALPESISALKTSGMQRNEKWDLYPSGSAAVKENPNAVVSPLNNGDYALSFNPAWGSKSKGFYAVGDNPEELVDYSMKKISRSDKAIDSAAKKKYESSLLGMLTSEYGDVFSLAKSTQSKSQYIVHNPSGTKIRIADHDLPLHYEQPDIDLRDWQSKDDMLQTILKTINK